MSQLSQWISATLRRSTSFCYSALSSIHSTGQEGNQHSAGVCFFLLSSSNKNFYLALLKVSHQQRLIFFATYTTYEEEEIKI